MIFGLALPAIQNPSYAYALNHVQFEYQILIRFEPSLLFYFVRIVYVTSFN